MKRYLFASAACVLFAALPAAAQDNRKCFNYTGPGVWTALDVVKLRADIDCFKVNVIAAAEKAIADARISIANREKRVLQLLASVGDAEEPELGKNLDKTPEYVASNFKFEDYIERGWPIAPSGAPDTVGAFRMICTPGHVLRDDPIVFPGQPGKSHLHQFFGNTTTNAFSTYRSLRSAGESTCGGMLNRSAYWIPAMLDGTGKVVRPDFVSIYYKRPPDNSPECGTVGICVKLPRGLRFVFGYNMVADTPPTGAGYYDCQGPTAKSGHYRLIAEVAPACGPGNQLGVVIGAPNCWNGKQLDSPDHRSHVAYTYYEGGKLRCPATHKYLIPGFTLGAWYSTGDASTGQAGSVTTWSLSSDQMNMGGKMVMMRPGETLHADWQGAWDEDAERIWMANCINKLLSCNSGTLGDGTAMKRTLPFSWKAEPRLVDIPAA